MRYAWRDSQITEDMNAIAPNDDPGARWSRFPFWTLVQALLTLAVLTTQQAQAAVECEAFRWEPERLDYNAAKDRRRISQVESHHFDARVESLVRGQTGRWPGGDDGLASMWLARLDRQPRPDPAPPLRRAPGDAAREDALDATDFAGQQPRSTPPGISRPVSRPATRRAPGHPDCQLNREPS